MQKKSCRIGAIFFILIALTLAVVVTFIPKQSFNFIVHVSRFFDVMWPVLGVGALIKYLLSNSGCDCHSDKDSCCK